MLAVPARRERYRHRQLRAELTAKQLQLLDELIANAAGLALSRIGFR
jgi:hypothetical protein